MKVHPDFTRAVVRGGREIKVSKTMFLHGDTGLPACKFDNQVRRPHGWSSIQILSEPALAVGNQRPQPPAGPALNARTNLPDLPPLLFSRYDRLDIQVCGDLRFRKDRSALRRTVRELQELIKTKKTTPSMRSWNISVEITNQTLGFYYAQ